MLICHEGLKKNPKQQQSPPHVSENTTLVGYMWATETAKFDFQSYRTSVVFTKTKKCHNLIHAPSHS